MQDVLGIAGYAVVLLLIVIMGVAVVSMFDSTMQTKILPDLTQKTGQNFTKAAQMSTTVKDVSNNYDYLVPLLVIVGGIVAFALAWQIPVSPIFLPISLIYFLIILVGGYFGQSMATQLLDLAENLLGVSFPLTRAMFEMWMLISALYGGIMLVATYAKPRFG